MADLHSYRAYFLTASDHIKAVKGFAAIDDSSACIEADWMLQHSEYAAVEVYQGWRLIWCRARDQQAA